MIDLKQEDFGGFFETPFAVYALDRLSSPQTRAAFTAS